MKSEVRVQNEELENFFVLTSAFCILGNGI